MNAVIIANSTGLFWKFSWSVSFGCYEWLVEAICVVIIVLLWGWNSLVWRVFCINRISLGCHITEYQRRTVSAMRKVIDSIVLLSAVIRACSSSKEETEGKQFRWKLDVALMATPKTYWRRSVDVSRSNCLMLHETKNYPRNSKYVTPSP